MNNENELCLMYALMGFVQGWAEGWSDKDISKLAKATKICVDSIREDKIESFTELLTLWQENIG